MKRLLLFMFIVVLGIAVNAQKVNRGFVDTVKADTVTMQFTDNTFNPQVDNYSGIAGFVLGVDTIAGKPDVQFEGRIPSDNKWVVLADSTNLGTGTYEFWDENPAYNDYRLNMLGESGDTVAYDARFIYKKP